MTRKVGEPEILLCFTNWNGDEVQFPISKTQYEAIEWILGIKVLNVGYGGDVEFSQYSDETVKRLLKLCKQKIITKPKTNIPNGKN